MIRTARSLVAGGVAAALLLYPPKAEPVLPIVAMMGKEVLKNIIMGEVKSQLIGALSSMGCKGAALAGVVAGTTSGRSPAGGIPRMPGGSADQAAQMMNGMPDAATMAQMMAAMQSQMGGIAPRAGAQPSPEQMAGIQGALAQMQLAMSHPLSPAETIEVFDELAELGVLTPAMVNEARECITLAGPGAGEAMGMTGAMMKSMVLPQLREVKGKLANLSPEEQEEVAAAMVEQLKSAPSTDRKAFLGGYGQGFYPKAIVDRVRARIE